MKDQFGQVRPGDRLPGLPTRPWNDLLDVLKKPVGGLMPASRMGGPIEVRVHNTTADPVYRFNILRVNAPVTLYSENAAAFFAEDALKGTAPAADAPFVVVQEPISAGSFGIARILGYTRVKINLTDVTHRFARPTSSLTELTSATSGPALILSVDSEDPGVGSGSGSGAGVRETGVQWAGVLIGGSGSGGGDVELVEPAGGSGSGAGCLQDYFITDIDPDACTATPGEAILFIDGNDPDLL